MAKVLISFLGTGPIQQARDNNDIPLSQRRYTPVDYEFIDEPEHTYSGKFVASVINKRYEIKKNFILGTVHSMWEEVFSFYTIETTDEKTNAFKNCYDKLNELSNKFRRILDRNTTNYDAYKDELKRIYCNDKNAEAYYNYITNKAGEYNESDWENEFLTILEEKSNEYQNAQNKEDQTRIQQEFIETVFTDYKLVNSINEKIKKLNNNQEKSKEEIITIINNFFEERYLHIAVYCEKTNYLSPLCIPHKTMIETALGKNSKVVLLKYGINGDEIEEIIKKIMSLEKYLNTGDELIIDITHSFRSLPLFIMNLILYLQNVKDLKISHIHYGMLEIRREMNGKAIIVDIKSILTINDWITGASNFKQYGNAYKLAELTKDSNKDLSDKLTQFSDILNLNHLSSIKSSTDELKSVDTENPIMAKILVKPIIDDFKKRFSKTKKNSTLQYELAKWQFEHKNYSAAYTSLIESVVTYTCEKKKYTWTKKDDRDKAKTQIRTVFKFDDDTMKLWEEIVEYRNTLVHSRNKDARYDIMIPKLSTALSILSKFFK